MILQVVPSADAATSCPVYLPKHSGVGPALHLQRWRFAVIWGWMPSEGTGRGIFLLLPYPDLYIVPTACSKPLDKSANPYSWPCTARAYSKPRKNGERVAGKRRNPEERKTKMTKQNKILKKREKIIFPCLQHLHELR